MFETFLLRIQALEIGAMPGALPVEHTSVPNNSCDTI